MSETKDPTNTDRVQEAVQKPPTKVFILHVGQTCSYDIYVEAESAEQAEQAWQVDQFEYDAHFQTNY